MSYLLDKKNKRNKILQISTTIVILLVLFYFRSSIFRGLSYVSQVVFHPVLVVGNGVGNKFSGIGSFFDSKSTLLKDNQDLQAQLDENKAILANYNSVLSDNETMKEILGRLPAQAGKNSKTGMTLSAILAKPNQSLYDTLVIDAGVNQGVSVGARVFALENIPIGRIAEVNPSSSKVILYSNPGEKTEVEVGKGIFLEAVGRGGGNFEITLTKNFALANGTPVLLPGIENYVLGIVQTTISDPRDSFQKALLTSPVNIEELKFVEIES